MNELVTKQGDSYVLSESGERTAYIKTTEKLSNYYLLNGLQKDPSYTKNKITALHPFLEKNYLQLTDFLQKLDLLSEFLEENNKVKFSQFMGRYFLSTLEKEKNNILQTEVPKVRYKFDNPYYTPGDDMLLKLASFFEHAPPLKWPPNGSPVTQPEAQAPEKPTPAKFAETRGDSSTMPGSIFLHNHASIFERAPALKISDISQAHEMAEESPAENIIAPRAVYTSAIVGSQDTMPGFIMLNKLGAVFAAAPPMRKENKPIVSAPKTGRQIRLPAYVSINNKISVFSKNQDNDGYRSWYQNLSPQDRLIVQINNYIKQEKSGQPFNWAAFYHKTVYMQKIEQTALERMKYDIQYFQNVLFALRHNFQNAVNQGENPAVIRNLYSPVIKLLDSNSSLEEKKVSLQMTLLQLSGAQTKEMLTNKLNALLEDFEKNK